MWSASRRMPLRFPSSGHFAVAMIRFERDGEGRGGCYASAGRRVAKPGVVGVPATASPPDACQLFRIEHIRLHTAWALFRQNLGERGAIIPPFGEALGAWMDEKSLEARRLPPVSGELSPV
jgi:hypothetical protein